MGRKARLKKIRRETNSSSASEPLAPSESDADPTKFVKELQQKGYQMQQIIRSPQIPDQNVNPQL